MRSLVLLLSSGHTVRIVLRDDELTDEVSLYADAINLLDDMVAVAVTPFASDDTKGDVIMAYVQDNATALTDHENEFNRITTLSPGSFRG